MEFLQNNYQTILLVLASAYPPLMYLLPVKIASKIDIGIKVIKAVADTLEKAKNTKGGLSTTSSETENKTFIQKSKL